MKRLDKTLCYLCGPMDRVPDGGTGWRKMITPILKDIGIGVLDPSDKPTSFAQEDDDFRNKINLQKVEKKFARSLVEYFLNICIIGFEEQRLFFPEHQKF